MPKQAQIQPQNQFSDVFAIIEQARTNAFLAVNRELIDMYWAIGQYISQKTKSENWGKSVVKELAGTIQNQYVGIKGFSPQNL